MDICCVHRVHGVICGRARLQGFIEGSFVELVYFRDECCSDDVGGIQRTMVHLLHDFVGIVLVVILLTPPALSCCVALLLYALHVGES